MSSHGPASQPVSLFYSYAHEDDELRATLTVALSPLRRQGLIEEWYDREIVPGQEWHQRILEQLDAADLILLLISSHFINSHYCYDIEMPRALARHDRKETWVIPIYLRPTAVTGLPFTRLQGLLGPDQPVVTRPDRDTALATIADGIRQAIAHLRRRAPAGPITPITLTPAVPRPRPWRRAVLALLLVLAGAGYYVASQHLADVRRHLADGKRFLDTGQYTQAQKAYGQALHTGWVLRRVARFGLEKASIYDADDKTYHPDVIGQRIERLLAQHPDDPHAHLFKGNSYAASGAYDQAIAWYERAVTLDPALAHGYFSLGLAYDKTARPDNALPMYERAVSLADWHPVYRNNLAYEYSRRQDYDRAEATYRQVLQQDDTFVLARFDIARYYYARGRPQEALPHLQHGAWLLANPQVAALEKNQGQWYFSLGEQHVPFDSLESKQCYAARSLAALSRLLGRADEATRVPQQPCELLSPSDTATIQHLVEAEMRQMGQGQ